ncbi:MAG: energy transducer TonB [Acidobacteriota bacterium]
MKVCPKCARSFAEGFQFCPQDAAELVKYDLRARLQAQDEFQFLIQHESLLTRLRRELAEAVFEFKHNPRSYLAGLLRGEGTTRRRKRLLQTGIASAVIVYGAMMLVGVITGLFTSRPSEASKFEMPTTSGYPILVVPVFTAKHEAAKGTAKSNQGALGGSARQKKDSGGGGGAHDKEPARSGVPTQASLQPQLRPPSLELPKIEHPSLITPMTVVADPNAFMKMQGRIGDWRAKGDAPSLGNGGQNGIGNGKGDGYSDGNKLGVGDGDPRFTNGRPSGPSNEVFVESRDLRPTILYKERAKYTEDARQNQIQGTVVLSVIFGADGRIHDVRALRSLPNGLTEEAISVVQRIRFNPAVRGGKPVSVRSTIEYNFTLY